MGGGAVEVICCCFGLCELCFLVLCIGEQWVRFYCLCMLSACSFFLFVFGYCCCCCLFDYDVVPCWLMCLCFIVGFVCVVFMCLVLGLVGMIVYNNYFGCVLCVRLFVVVRCCLCCCVGLLLFV